MSRQWINDLAAAATESAEKNRHHHEATQLVDAAFERIRSELTDVVDDLNQRFPLRLSIRSVDGGLRVDAQSAKGKYKSIRLFMNADLRELSSQPEGALSLQEDRHEFRFDFDRMAFLEGDVELEDEDVVRLALEAFLKANLVEAR
ncbi:MAG TPA: hypothetical protein VF911_19060 [Thermoanaerobaculia bacterium]